MAGFMVGHVACRNVIDDTFKEYLGQYKGPFKNTFKEYLGQYKGPFKNIYFLQKEA